MIERGPISTNERSRLNMSQNRAIRPDKVKIENPRLIFDRASTVTGRHDGRLTLVQTGEASNPGHKADSIECSSR